MKGKSFLGCSKCYRNKKNCKCNFNDLHKITENRFDYWKFKVVEESCGKKIGKYKYEPLGDLLCGDAYATPDKNGNIEYALCDECKQKQEKKENGN